MAIVRKTINNLCIKSEDVKGLKDSFKKYYIEPEVDNENYISFCFQKDNVEYHIDMLINIDSESQDAKCIKTFQDIQQHVFNKVIWK